mgnify:FL=1
MSLDSAKQKNILISILKEIYSHPGIGPVMGFKGGTAAYHFYNLDRFSVDLDFDLLDWQKAEPVYAEIRKLLKPFGKIKQTERTGYSLTFHLVSGDTDTEPQEVKLEINRWEFGSRFILLSNLGVPMNVMIPEDMLANKLVAMTQRMGKANRDLYDAWFFLSHGWQVNAEIVEKRTGLPLNRFLEKCRESVAVVNTGNILSGMGELTNKKQETWIKNNLKSELVFQLNLYLEKLSKD